MVTLDDLRRYQSPKFDLIDWQAVKPIQVVFGQQGAWLGADFCTLPSVQVRKDENLKKFKRRAEELFGIPARQQRCV